MIDAKKIFDEAYRIASQFHANDVRKDGVTPYMVHIDVVVANVERIARETYPTISEYHIYLIKAVAALHDTLEDHPTEINRIDLFARLLLTVPTDDLSGSNISELYADVGAVVAGVEAITKKPKGVEPYDSYVRRVLAHEWARLVKLADLEHNLSDLGPGSMRDKYELTKWVLETVKVS